MATWLAHAVLAAVAYVPLLCTAPGRVGADTKAYLYLDPTRWLSQVTSMWDPDLAMGSVTHEYIGYLLPMGPYFAFMHVLGVPTWVAQRLWTGSLMFLAGAGVLFLLRTLSIDMTTWRGLGAEVAALAYMLSPYVMQYEARESVLLLPWVGLPWMVGATARALRGGGWRYPAVVALVVALVGSTNAPSLLFVGIGPVLWVVWELLAGRVQWRRALATSLKIGALSALVSLWWIAGLYVERPYLGTILRTTESIPTVTRTSSAAETLRGLGYWFFYGVDKLGLYLTSAAGYMNSLWLLAVSFAVPALGFLAAFCVRWRERAYFIVLVLVGTVLAVGAHPLSAPTPLGRLQKAGATGSSLGLALRSTTRAAPLVILGIAVLLGAAVAAVAQRWKVAGVLAAAATTGLVAADIPALWSGQFVTTTLSRPEQVPAYWVQAANYLGHQPGASDTRVLTEPGSDFAAYRWGMTLDPVLPGLMTRPEVERGVVPYGSAGSANLLEALDEEVQSGTLDPSALAPIARLMSAGDIVVQSDLQYERYNTPRPRALWQVLDPSPAGLGPAVGFGSPSVTAAAPTKYPLIDETELGLPSGAPYPPPVAVLPVTQPRSIIRSEGVARPLLVDGDGSGLVAAAGAGLLDGQATVLYSASFAHDPGGMANALAHGADLVVTDTNRRHAEQFGTVRENFGYTETAGEKPLAPDVRDVRLPLFPGSGDDTKAVTQQLGVQSIQASSYGNPITYAPESRPDQAMDGDLRTAWTVGAFDDPVGQYLRITLAGPLTANHVTLVQPLYGPRDRWITRATLRFDGGHPVAVALGPSSRTSAGQVVSFASRTFNTLQITIDATNVGPRPSYDGLSGVGFAEVQLAGQQASEVVRMPTDLLHAAGTASLGHRLTLVMTRQRTAPVPPRTDPEVDVQRVVSLPTARTFSVTGIARVSSLVPDDDIDRLLGTVIPGVTAYSSGRLPGDIQDRASSTLDADQHTVWSPGLGPQAGNWLEYDLARPLTFNHLSMAVVTDGRHSVPTAMTVSAGGQSRSVALPPLHDVAGQGATQTVTVQFPALSGTNIRVTFDALRPVTDLDYYSGTQVELPMAVAEVAVPGMPGPRPTPAQIPSTCRSDLLSVDGVPVPVTVSGASATASTSSALQLRGCGPAAAGVTLGPGQHEIATQPGSRPGVDLNVDSLALDSAPGGGALPAGLGGRVAAAESGPAPTMKVQSSGTTSANVVVHAPTAPFWLVLGQSTNSGWHASASGADLGPPQLVDGYANGWLVTPSTPGRDMVITLRWTPQRMVWAALAASAVALALCLALACWPRRTRRMVRVAVQDDAVRRPAPFEARPPAASVLVGAGTGPPSTVPAPTAPGGVDLGSSAAPNGPWVAASAHASNEALWTAAPDVPGLTGRMGDGDQGGAGPPPPPLTPPRRQSPAAEARAATGRDAGVDPALPMLGAPWRSSGRRPRWFAVALATLVAGGVTAAVFSPRAGLLVAAATAGALMLSYGRVVLAAASVAFLVAVDETVTAAQGHFHYLAEFSWPTHFESASDLAWLAITLLAADALVQVLRDRRARQVEATGTRPRRRRRGRHARRGPRRATRSVRWKGA
jgi:hypothetical protein